MFDEYIRRWELKPDGEPVIRDYSRLLPVRYRGQPAMLKIATDIDERWGGAVMTYWNGRGAMRVFAHHEDALLMERSTGHRSLGDIARNGGDEAATRILCNVAGKLHAPRSEPPPAELVKLVDWFAPLAPAAATHGGVLAKADAAARELLANPQEVVVLHGDVHHGNVLDCGAHGWLAIDPKRLVGERGFDFVNIVRNPDIATSLIPGRLSRQVDIIADAANLDRTRFLQWVLAFTGLSAAWIFAGGDEPTSDLALAEMAAAELAQRN